MTISSSLSKGLSPYGTLLVIVARGGLLPHIVSLTSPMKGGVQDCRLSK